MKIKNEELINQLLIHKFSLNEKIKAIDNVLNILKQEEREILQCECSEARKKVGMSVRELAKKAGTGMSAVYHLERGKYVHSKTYTKIFNILELSTN